MVEIVTNWSWVSFGVGFVAGVVAMFAFCWKNWRTDAINVFGGKE